MGIRNETHVINDDHSKRKIENTLNFVIVAYVLRINLTKFLFLSDYLIFIYFVDCPHFE